MSIMNTLNRITRDNIDTLLDRGMIETAMKSGKWWTIRRNGKTWRGKRDKSRIRVPIKGGLNVYGTITEIDFLPDGTLDPKNYRLNTVAKTVLIDAAKMIREIG